MSKVYSEIIEIRVRPSRGDYYDDPLEEAPMACKAVQRVSVSFAKDGWAAGDCIVKKRKRTIHLTEDEEKTLRILYIDISKRLSIDN